MKFKTTLILAIWLLSVVLGYLVGAGLLSSGQDTSDDSTESPPSRTRPLSRGSTSSEEREPRTELAFILEQDNFIPRTSRLLELIKRLEPDEFKQAADDFLASGFAVERREEYNLLLQAWAKVDPLSAIEFTNKGGPVFHQQAVLRSWGQEDPTAAIMWSETSYQGAYGDLLLSRIIGGLVDTDPLLATDIMNSKPPGRSRDLAMWTIASNVARLGKDEASEWLSSIEDETLRNEASARIATSLTRKDPETSAAWATAIQAEEARNQAIAGVAAEWTKKDFASAFAWAETLGVTERASAAKSLIAAYTLEDPVQASQWMTNFENSDDYQEIIKQFVTAAPRDNPELALGKISAIQGTSLRNRYYTSILGRWYQRDMSASEEWMHANNISADIRERVVNPSQQ